MNLNEMIKKMIFNPKIIAKALSASAPAKHEKDITSELIELEKEATMKAAKSNLESIRSILIKQVSAHTRTIAVGDSVHISMHWDSRTISISVLLPGTILNAHERVNDDLMEKWWEWTSNQIKE